MFIFIDSYYIHFIVQMVSGKVYRTSVPPLLVRFRLLGPTTSEWLV
jgi:hypothetical protein